MGDPKQIARIKSHCKALGRDSMPSLKLLHWSMKLIRLNVERSIELDHAYWLLRRMQDDVVEMLDLQTPWQYFHLMNLMTMVNLMLWAYSFALETTHFASVIFVF